MLSVHCSCKSFYCCSPDMVVDLDHLVVQLLCAVEQGHNKGVCHGEKEFLEGEKWLTFGFVDLKLLLTRHFAYYRWYQVWECSCYFLELAISCRLCIFQANIHTRWWPFRFFILLWHWWEEAMLSRTWGGILASSYFPEICRFCNFFIAGLNNQFASRYCQGWGMSDPLR